MKLARSVNHQPLTTLANIFLKTDQVQSWTLSLGVLKGWVIVALDSVKSVFV